MNKFSMFNFITLNDNNELLLYNSLLGKRSICKVKNKNIIENIIKKNIQHIPLSVIEKMVDRGLIVDKKLNEVKKLYNFLYEVVNPRILHLVINVTEHCNFRCKYCYEKFSNGEINDEIKDKIINYIKYNIQNYTGLRISWFGGEPLLALNSINYLSIEFIKICKFHHRSYSADITTNGYLLSKKIFEKLLKLKIHYYQITIDGTKKIHDNQRLLLNRQGTFDKIINNLMEIKTSKYKNFKISIRTNFTKEIFQNMDEYLKLMELFCQNDNRFLISVFKVGKWSDKFDKDLEALLVDNSSNYMREIYQKIYESTYKINLNINFLSPGYGQCYGAKKNSFVISSKGTLHKCTILFENKESIVGEINKNAIYLNDKYYNLISSLNSCKKLAKCFLSPICTGNPCPYKRKNDNKCVFIKNNLDLILKIIDKNSEIPCIE